MRLERIIPKKENAIKIAEGEIKQYNQMLKNTPLAPVTKTTNRTYTSQEKSLMASELSQRFSMNKDLISKRIEKNSPDF